MTTGILDGHSVSIRWHQEDGKSWIECRGEAPGNLAETKRIDEDTIICTLRGKGHDDHQDGATVLYLDQVGPERSASASGEKLNGIQDASDQSFRLRSLYIKEPRELEQVFSRFNVPSDGPLSRPVLHVIFSPLSGAGLAPKFFHQVVVPLIYKLNLPFRSDGPSIHYHNPTSAPFIEDLARQHIGPAVARGESQTIVLLSGDGGVVELLNGLILGVGIHDKISNEIRLPSTYRKPTLCLLPHGTANALAHSTRIADATHGLRALVTGTPIPLPIFRASFSPGAMLLTNEGRDRVPLRQAAQAMPGTNAIYGAVVFSWALHATLVADSDTAEYRRHGAKRFQMAAQALLFPEDGDGPHAFKGKLSTRSTVAEEAAGVEEEAWTDLPRDEHGYLLATLVSNLERTFTISPASRPLDGQMRLLEFGPTTGEQCMRVLMKAYEDGAHIGMDGVGYNAIDALWISFKEPDPRWRRCCVDGRIILVEHGGFVQVKTVDLPVLDLAWNKS